MSARDRGPSGRPARRALVLLVLVTCALGVASLPSVMAQEDELTLALPSARDAHAAAQAAVLARAAELIVGIDRVGDGFVRPLPGAISSLFGWRNISVGGNRFHGGLDIAADTGTPVMAARGGVVARAGWGGVYGYHVVLDHDAGWETRYAHLSRIDVVVGERVRQGGLVGLVGSTGASTGPHLHFEIRYQGRALDPLAYIGR